MSFPRVSHRDGDLRKYAAGINHALKHASTKADAITDLTVTATSGTLPTADGSVTIANAASPTVAELLEYCRELEAKLELLLAAARTHGAIAA